ncbi:MAG TPA: hypothetical protein VF322_16540 [Gammaproteobacteria bacterium]
MLSGVEQASIAAQYVSSIASLLNVAGRRELIVACGGTPYALRYDDNDGNGRLSSGDVLRMERPQCANYALDLSFTVDALTTTPAALTGRGTFDLTVVTPALRVQGSFDLTHTGDVNDLRWSLSDIALTVTRDGVVATVAGGTIEKSLDATERYRVTFSGSIDSARWGVKIDFETPVAFEGTSGAFPSAGEAVLTAGNSKVRITPTGNQALGGTYADLAIDASGAGYGVPQTPKWPDLPLGSLFGWYPNDPPVITSLRIEPATPTAVDQLRAVYDALDPEGVPLQPSFEWSVNGVTVLSGMVANTFAGLFAKGDEVEVTLTVSDGHNTATATASVTIGNAPPVITTLTITPADPDTTDDLAASYAAHDPDGDALTFSHVWRVNGTVIEGQTGPTLPASAHERDDVVTVEVLASDGAATTSLEASTTILDAPAFVSVASPPGTATYGSLVQFEATVEDPDGDPVGGVRFALTHGPAGMTVDPVTGKVTWSPRRRCSITRSTCIGV